MRKFTLFLTLFFATAMTMVAQITSVDQLSNDKCYTIVSKDTGRGGMFAAEGAAMVDMCGVTYNQAQDCHSIARDANDPRQQFAFVNYEGKLYLYSVSEKKFVVKSGNVNKLTNEAPIDYVEVTLEAASGGDYFSIKLGGTNYMTASPGWCSNPERNTCLQSTLTAKDPNEGWDDGAWYTITEAGSFNATEAIKIINPSQEAAPLTVTSIAPEANATVESLEQIVVTFDKEVASVDASMISVAEVAAESGVTPIEAYAGNWEVTTAYGESGTIRSLTIEVVEVDGVKKLKVTGASLLNASHYNDAFYLDYEAETGNVILRSQDLESFSGNPVHLYLAISSTAQIGDGNISGNIVDGNIVFTDKLGYGIDSFMYIAVMDGQANPLSYFCELTWRPVTAAASSAPIALNNIMNVKLAKDMFKAAKSAAQVEATVNGNQVVITVNGELADGAYKLTIAEGAVVAADGGVNEAIEAVYNVVAPEPEPTYEYNDGYSNHSGRAFKSFTVTDGTNSVAVTDIQKVGKTPIYHDKTACVLETTAGAKISFSEFTWEGWWMHAYGYIDYNKDYVFGQDANATGTTGGELVTYNCYSTDNGSTYQDIYGNTASPETANLDTYYDMDDFSESKGLPHFYLPADLAAGDYRMRIKIDWNNIDPVKGSAKDIYGGGAQVDFIIRVAEAAVEPLTVAAITPEAGNVESIKEVVVTFDSELASVDASKISVEKVITPIEAYEGDWSVLYYYPGYEQYNYYVTGNISIAEVDGTQVLKCKGFCDYDPSHDDTFIMDYDPATGNVTIQAQYISGLTENGVNYDATLYMSNSDEFRIFGGSVIGNIKDGKLVFENNPTNSKTANSILFYASSDASNFMLSYFGDLTWTRAGAASAAKNINKQFSINEVSAIENFAPAKAAKAEETEAAIEVSASVNGKDLIITTNVAANGTYKLVVAEGAVVAANGATNENIEAEYNVYREPTTIVNVTPAKAVTELDVIEIEYNVEIAGEFDVMGMTQIYVGSKSNGAAYEVNGKVLTIDLFNSITTPGDYALHIPAGLITRVSDGSDVTCDGEIVFTVKEPGYEYVEGNSGNGSRRLDSFTITDGTNSLTVTDIQATTTSPIFVDKTDNVLETTAGAYISFTEFNWEGYWMHAYAYIDYNCDFTFDQVANADGTTGGELVTYNCYSTDGGSTYQDIYGNTASPENANKEIYYDEDFNESKGLPQFYLPADLAAGDYRMRIKIDWNNIDPLGDKDIRPNGGAQVDFIIRVAEAPSYEYNEGDRNHGERALTSFTITDGTNSLNVTDIHQTGKGAIFVDKTDNVFETTAGAAVSFSEFNYLGVWMHAYAYIDYNNDYTFGQDANATGTTGGELVTYNCYSTDGSNYYDIWGNTASPSNANSETYYDEDFNESKGLPHFFLPADLAVGDYRMRIKVDWNNLDPVQGSKDMVNGGCEVDFIVRVAEATGIENVEVENGAQVIYDLTGRKVENANVRGIYIINGKKVLVK